MDKPSGKRATPQKNKNVAFVEAMAKRQRDNYAKNSNSSPNQKVAKDLNNIVMNTEMGTEIGLATLKETQKLNKNLMTFMKKVNGMSNFDRLKRVENAREKNKKKGMFNIYDKTKTENRRDFAKGGLIGLLLGKINPLNAMKFMFGGTIASAGAWVGLRGWETKFMKGFYQRFFKNIGVDKNGKLLGYKPSKAVSMISRMETRVAKFFGADMGMKQNRTKSGKFTKGKTPNRVPIIEKVTDGVSKLFDPLRKFAMGMDKWIITKGAGLMSFIGKISGLSGLFRIVGKILFPIGVLFSAFDGIKAWQKSKEATPILRFIDGISAFIGDFIGAPLNLLKDVIGWGLKKIGLKSAGEWLQSWDIEGMITKLSKSFFGFIHRLITGAEQDISTTQSKMKYFQRRELGLKSTEDRKMGMGYKPKTFNDTVDESAYGKFYYKVENVITDLLDNIVDNYKNGVTPPVKSNDIKPMLSPVNKTHGKWLDTIIELREDILNIKAMTIPAPLVVTDNSSKQNNSSVQTTNMMSMPNTRNMHYGIN